MGHLRARRARRKVIHPSWGCTWCLELINRHDLIVVLLNLNIGREVFFAELHKTHRVEYEVMEYWEGNGGTRSE